MTKILTFLNHLSSNKLRYISFYISLLLLFSVLWIIKTFGNPSYEQILFHVLYQTSDLSNFDRNMLISYSQYAIIVPIALLIIFACVENFIQDRMRTDNKNVKLLVRVTCNYWYCSLICVFRWLYRVHWACWRSSVQHI